MPNDSFSWIGQQTWLFTQCTKKYTSIMANPNISDSLSFKNSILNLSGVFSFYFVLFVILSFASVIYVWYLQFVVGWCDVVLSSWSNFFSSGKHFASYWLGVMTRTNVVRTDNFSKTAANDCEWCLKSAECSLTSEPIGNHSPTAISVHSSTTLNSNVFKISPILNNS